MFSLGSQVSAQYPYLFNVTKQHQINGGIQGAEAYITFSTDSQLKCSLAPGNLMYGRVALYWHAVIPYPYQFFELGWMKNCSFPGPDKFGIVMTFSTQRYVNGVLQWTNASTPPIGTYAAGTYRYTVQRELLGGVDVHAGYVNGTYVISASHAGQRIFFADASIVGAEAKNPKANFHGPLFYSFFLKRNISGSWLWSTWPSAAIRDENIPYYHVDYMTGSQNFYVYP